MTLDEYRNEIIGELLKKKNSKGELFMSEEAARKLLSNLSDEELNEGILFNTPDDIANLLIEIGKLD